MGLMGKDMAGNRRWVKWPLFILLIIQLAAGCSNLCTKRLYIYRDTPEKGRSAANLALLITDPEMANGVLATANRFPEGGCQWGEEQPSYQSNFYRLTVEQVDGKSVYQGMCMDVAPTYVCEVAAGRRQVRVKMLILGPEGKESVKEEANLSLEPGKCYFLQPDCEAFQNKRLQLKIVPLPAPYTGEMRGRVIVWQKQHTKGASLED